MLLVSNLNVWAVPHKRLRALLGHIIEILKERFSGLMWPWWCVQGALPPSSVRLFFTPCSAHCFHAHLRQHPPTHCWWYAQSLIWDIVTCSQAQFRRVLSANVIEPMRMPYPPLLAQKAFRLLEKASENERRLLDAVTRPDLESLIL